jgi:phosphatidylglycerophosphate synthase
MLDPLMRKIMDPPLNLIASLLPADLRANHITITGFLIGLLCFGAILLEQYSAALVLLCLNRLLDGIDGAVARYQNDTSDLGAYLDIVSDFLIWAILPLGFLFGAHADPMAVAFLLSSFAMSMTVFLAFAVLAEKRALTTQAQGRKSFFYLAGLAEGSETILFFAACMIWPSSFTYFAYGFAILVYLSVAVRLIGSWQTLSDT